MHQVFMIIAISRLSFLITISVLSILTYNGYRYGYGFVSFVKYFLERGVIYNKSVQSVFLIKTQFEIKRTQRNEVFLK